jgi:hypothetical membrane protein
VLTTGRYGKITLTVAVLLGLCIAGVAIYMEEQHYWVTIDSLLWFAVATPVIVIAFQWLSWRGAKFALRQNEKPNL